MVRSFGRLPDGREVFCFTLTDGRICCEVLTYGATLRTLFVQDRIGGRRDVVLGFDRLEDYISGTCYLGATVGRFANRIGGACFSLDGSSYLLSANDGNNHLHGGTVGFDRQLWTVEEAAEDRLSLGLVSPDGQEGYPGTLRVRVTYTVADGALRLDYFAETDRPTLCNLTNHSYFNLNGHASGSVLHHVICLHADSYTPTDAASIPTGSISAVDGTPMDLRQPTRIGAKISEDFPQLKQAGGYDHNFIPNGEGLRELAWAAGDQSGIRLYVESTQPGVQFYTANFLKDQPVGKDGAVYTPRDGFCLETQAFPDAPHHPNFPGAVLLPGECCRQTTVFRFSTLP